MNQDMIKKTILSIAISGLIFSTPAIAAESNLPSMFSAPIANANNIKKEITEAERRALDHAILNVNESSLPVDNNALKGNLPIVDQDGRLQQMSKLYAANNEADNDNDNKISPYPKFSTPAQPLGQVKPKPQVNVMLDTAMRIYVVSPEITLAPGEPTTITVGLAQANKISFNFDSLDVRTTNTTVPMIIEGGDLYITPTSMDEPIGLLVGETGIPDSQINILLLPAPVPQIIAHVTVKMTPKMRNERLRMKTEKADKIAAAEAELKSIEKALERGDSNLQKNNTPYVSRIVDLLVEVAKENIPKGFSLNLNIAEKDKYPCDTSKLIMKHETVMQLESSKEIIDIVKITNDINGYRSVEDEYCIGPGVYAAATYEKSHLAPGESTEMYILRDKHYKRDFLKEQSRKRPSIIH